MELCKKKKKKFIGTCACTSLWNLVKVIMDTHALACHVLCLLFINISFASGRCHTLGNGRSLIYDSSSLPALGPEQQEQLQLVCPFLALKKKVQRPAGERVSLQLHPVLSLPGVLHFVFLPLLCFFLLFPRIKSFSSGLTSLSFPLSSGHLNKHS